MSMAIPGTVYPVIAKNSYRGSGFAYRDVGEGREQDAEASSRDSRRGRRSYRLSENLKRIEQGQLVPQGQDEVYATTGLT
jgi:hypothetical protein